MDRYFIIQNLQFTTQSLFCYMSKDTNKDNLLYLGFLPF